jgi:hypothetical protein
MDAKLKFGIVYSTRATFILQNSVTINAAPARQLTQTDFFSMVEDLPNHVRAMKTVVSSGVPHSFFKNVFVKDYITKLAHDIKSSTAVRCCNCYLFLLVVKIKRYVQGDAFSLLFHLLSN